MEPTRINEAKAMALDRIIDAIAELIDIQENSPRGIDLYTDEMEDMVTEVLLNKKKKFMQDRARLEEIMNSTEEELKASLGF